MKLVKQIRLFFQEGTSDKVYEIDLCESGEGYVVNFRYGRRGASLKEGTKTIFPVELSQAEKLLSSLEDEKRKKGYVAAGEAQIVTSQEPKSKPVGDKRKKAIIKLLKTAAAGEEPEHWRLSRIIWSAGDLKIPEAIPYIIKISDPSDTFATYSAVWAIARCGTSKALDFLKDLNTKQLPQFTKQLIREAQLKLSEGKEKDELLKSILHELPANLLKPLQEKDYRELEKQLRELLFNLKTASNEYLIALYQLSRENNTLHQLFLGVLNDIPMETNYFKYLRQIFKTAEMLEDYSTYSVVAKNIEKSPSKYNSTSWMTADQKKNVGFSDKTKKYLTGRVLRFLERYGETDDASFTDMAANILLAFDDSKDLTLPYHTSEFRYEFNTQTRAHTSHERRTDFDTYSKFLAYNFILYKNSPRYTAKNKAWICVPPYKPGDAAPSQREEAFPHLWDKDSESIIGLLSFSKSLRVHEFALKVFKANPAFEDHLEIQDVIHFLQAKFSITQQAGLDMARKKYNRNEPSKLLLVAMLDGSLEEARRQAESWLADQRTTLLSDSEFITALLLMRTQEAHAWLRGFLITVTFSEEVSSVVMAKMVAHLVSVNIISEDDERYVLQVGDTFVSAFADGLKRISLGILKDLFNHPSPVVHAIAGKILLRHDIRPELLPEDFLQLLLQSENVQSRGIGIALLGKFPDDKLLEKKEILVSFCLSPKADVRNAVKPIIDKLVKAYPEFGKELVDLFVPAFLMKESYEGLHDDLLHLLSNELASSLNIISKERTILLLQSKFRAAQLMGVVLLKRNIQESSLSIPEVVKLASNPQQDVRTFAWNYFNKYPENVKANKEEAIRITDSYWDDTRIFAFDYLRNTFADTDWNTDLLVTLCDSTKEDVQDFGREMITKFFQADNGTAYLLKLSQHPNTKVQLFTTAYLEKYAADNAGMIQTLVPYFITLLSQVNKGKVAKARVFEFLRTESLKNEDVAKITAEIFTRVSVSVALTEKAFCIKALRDLSKKYPAIQSPILIKEHFDYSNK